MLSLSLFLRRGKKVKAKPHPLSNYINSLTGQRTGAFLGMECDNNNDIGNASVKALDNKLCSEACLPGEWQSAEHELCGAGRWEGSLTCPTLTSNICHLSDAVRTEHLSIHVVNSHVEIGRK